MEIPTVDEVRTAVGGRYTVEQLHGHGGMGAVFIGKHSSLDSAVAIKVIRLPAEEGSQELARFKREAKLSANLPHPNIVPVHEFEVEGNLAYFVMPFVKGESLADYLKRRGRLPYSETRDLLRQIGSGLEFAHERGVVHRDVKPANILREEATGRWLITDFGIAHGARTDDTAITRTGMVLGTPAYMSPEQAAGVDVDARADLYALAAVACEALTGNHTDTLIDAAESARRLSEALPDLPPALATAITAPLALDRQLRPASVEAWLGTLEPAARESSVRAILVGATVAAALVVGGMGTWWWLNRAPAEVETPTIAIVPFSVSGELQDVDLRTGLAKAFEDQLRWIPEYRIVTPTLVERAVADEFGGVTPSWDSLGEFAARNFGASELLFGSVVVTASRELRINVQVRESTSRRIVRQADAVGSVDSLAALVSALVSETFAERLARQQVGWSAALPRGLDAFHNYLEADRYFRRAAYDEAIEQYELVIERDSTFAPAYFKRMLCEMLRVRPTRATVAVRSALDAARRYREGLDPTTRELLGGYEILVGEGDLERALEVFQRIVDEHPNAVDAWFVFGYLQFTLAPLLGMDPIASQWAFTRANELDPEFAAAIAQLAFIGILEENQPTAQRHLSHYRQVDTGSVWSQLAGMTDTLLYGSVGEKLAVRRSFGTRPLAALEILALAGGRLRLRRPERLVSQDAMHSLWERATTRQDRAVAFRMRMANLLGTNRAASVDSLLREARRRNVPQDEVDRWIVLSAVTGVAQLGTPSSQAGAARRLATNQPPDAIGLWLAARWYHDRDPEASTQAAGMLRAYADSADATPLAKSLRDDLDALDQLAAGDTAAATARWKQATGRYSVEQVPFGLVGSLWPLRLDLARVAAATGDHGEVLAVTGSFEHMAGFIDQVAWSAALPLRAAAFEATGDGLGARSTLEALRDVLQDANGSRIALRDSVEALFGAN